MLVTMFSKLLNHIFDLTNNKIFVILSLVIINLLIQGYFIDQINFISPQDTGFLSIAKKMISSDTVTDSELELMKPYEIYPPVYPAICRIISLFTGDLDKAPRIYHIIFSSAILIPIFLISLRLYGKETAIISSLLLTFLPALSTTIYYSVRHVSFIFFLYLSLYFVMVGDLENKIKYYALGGLFFGITYLIRAEVLIIVFTILCIIFLKGIGGENKQFKNTFSKSIVFLCFFLSTFLPQYIYTYDLTGNSSLGGDKKWQYDHFVTGQGVVDKIKGDSNDIIEYGYKVYGSAEENHNSIITAIRNNPRAYIDRVIKNFKILLDLFSSPTVIPFYLYPFMGLTLVGLIGNPKQLKDSIFFIATIVSFILLWTIVFFVQAKYLIPLVPVLTIWISHGIKLTQDKIRMENTKKLFVYFPSIFAVLSLAIIFVTYTKAVSSDIPRETKAIGEWIKSNTSASDLVIIPKKWFDEKFYLQYYSKRKVRNYSSMNGESILILREGQVDLYKKDLNTRKLNTFMVKGNKIVIYGIP